jgi:hypothetical protein
MKHSERIEDYLEHIAQAIDRAWGASFNNEAINLRAANRNRNEPDNRNNNLGFRCVRDVERRSLKAFRAARAGEVTAKPGVPFHFRAVRLT